MGLNSYKVSAPGSLMLLGEYAVLDGKQAVVAAINQRITVYLTPKSQSNEIKIISELGDCSVVLDKFKIIKPHDYVLTSIKKYLPKITQGFVLKIESDFSSKIGFGSSAAVTVAVVAVLHQWLSRKKIALPALYRKAFAVVKEVQGCGSGADVAASIFGGVIAYKNTPFVIKKLNNSLPIVVVYSGNKVATPKVIAKVQSRNKKFSKIFKNIYKAIDSCSKAAIPVIKNKQWDRLGELFDLHQGLHEALGVSTDILSRIVYDLRDQTGIYGAKISGSGLGDSVIGLGRTKKKRVKQLEVKVDAKGLRYLSVRI